MRSITDDSLNVKKSYSEERKRPDVIKFLKIYKQEYNVLPRLADDQVVFYTDFKVDFYYHIFTTTNVYLLRFIKFGTNDKGKLYALFYNEDLSKNVKVYMHDIGIEPVEGKYSMIGYLKFVPFYHFVQST